MTENQVKELLLKRAKKFAINAGASGINNWCAAHNVQKSHVSEWMRGKRAPPPQMISALGLEISYTRKRGQP